MERRSLRNLKNIFRTGVGIIDNDEDYYAKIFNEGIRLLDEIERHPNSLALAELLRAFEKYNEWIHIEHYMKELRLAIVECIVDHN